MSSQERPHARKDEGQKPAKSPPKDETKKPPAQTDRPGLKYVFKIAPADPKSNTIDFEDVADK